MQAGIRVARGGLNLLIQRIQVRLSAGHKFIFLVVSVIFSCITLLFTICLLVLAFLLLTF
jgi:hypothetical protein